MDVAETRAEGRGRATHHGAAIHVGRPTLGPSPAGDGWWRLQAKVEAAGSNASHETIWIDGPDWIEAPDRSGTPWAVLLAPWAAHLGATLSIDAPVDPTVVDGVQAVSRVWAEWYPEVSQVRVEAAKKGDAASRGGPRRSASFFTGGVDSLWTAIHHLPPGKRDSAHELICVHGFDIPLRSGDVFDRMVRRFGSWAAARGGRVVPVRTNLRESGAEAAPWGPLAHGCALVGVGLSLGVRHEVLRIASTGGERDRHPWGSHVDTDPLLSSASTRVEQHGEGLARWEKVSAIAEDPGALELLRVCWRSGTDVNCGVCSKCLRTMALLDVLGALERAPTFPHRLPLDSLGRVHVKESWDEREFTDLTDFARRAGRGDIVAAAQRAMSRSRAGDRALARLDRLARLPVLGRFAREAGARVRESRIS